MEFNTAHSLSFTFKTHYISDCDWFHRSITRICWAWHCTMPQENSVWLALRVFVVYCSFGCCMLTTYRDSRLWLVQHFLSGGDVNYDAYRYVPLTYNSYLPTPTWSSSSTIQTSSHTTSTGPTNVLNSQFLTRTLNFIPTMYWFRPFPLWDVCEIFRFSVIWPWAWITDGASCQDYLPPQCFTHFCTSFRDAPITYCIHVIVMDADNTQLYCSGLKL